MQDPTKATDFKDLVRINKENKEEEEAYKRKKSAYTVEEKQADEPF